MTRISNKLFNLKNIYDCYINIVMRIICMYITNNNIYVMVINFPVFIF